MAKKRHIPINELLRDEILRRNVLWFALLKRNLLLISMIFRNTNREIDLAMLEGNESMMADLSRRQILQKVALARRLFDAGVSRSLPLIEQAAGEAGAASLRFWNRQLVNVMPTEFTASIGMRSVNPELVFNVGRREVLGLSPSSWAGQQKRLFARQAQLELMTSQGFGESIHQAAKRLTDASKPFGLANRLGWKAAEGMARTAFIGAAARVERAWVQRNRDILKGELYVATLDSRTCQVCGSLDGTFYSLDASRPTIPVHSRCRCVYVPQAKSWRELGVDLDELSPQFRASMNGEVAGSMNYDSWLRSLDDSDARDILGPGRWNIWNAKGRPDLGDFVDGRRVLTLDELV